MCLLPIFNSNFNSIQYRKGIHYFDCGACPECLRKRANYHALTSVYEAKAHSKNCMITLTYDTFVRDGKGKICRDDFGKPIENPVDPDLKVNVRHVQLFIKRLRKYISYHYPNNEKIKYRISAEYGSRTHRAHYHAIIFGFDFPDRHYYKKSSRGNSIYMSSVLTKLWNHGICTVDSVNVHSGIARYCSKYLAKSRSDKTFSLSSQSLGLTGLLRDFNGINYMIDGREYTIPRKVWETYIVSKYQRRYMFLKNVPTLNPSYVNRSRNLSDFDVDYMYEYSMKCRAFYRTVRDRDPLYVKYLAYWQRKGELFESLRPSPRQRILLLDDSKYHFYKISALECYDKRKSSFYDIPYIAPGSGCVSAYARYLDKHFLSLAPISRPIRASDTISPYLIKYGLLRNHFLMPLLDISPFFVQSVQQLSFDIP